MPRWMKCIPTWLFWLWLGLFSAGVWMGMQIKPKSGQEMRLFFKLWDADGKEVGGAKVVRRNGVDEPSPQTLPSPLLGKQDAQERFVIRLKQGREVEFSITWKSARAFREWFDKDFSKQHSGKKWTAIHRSLDRSINEKTNSYTYPLVLRD